MKKRNSCYIIILLLVNCNVFSQESKIPIHYKVTYNKMLNGKKEVVDNIIMVNYFVNDTLFFKNNLNLKLYFIDNKIFLKKQLLYCFKNILYYESLLLFTIDKKQYLYIYPHYRDRNGPYIWYELGILIEIKKIPVVKENYDYFEDYELNDLLKFKKYKIRNLKNKTCDDGL